MSFTFRGVVGREPCEFLVGVVRVGVDLFLYDGDENVVMMFVCGCFGGGLAVQDLEAGCNGAFAI